MCGCGCNSVGWGWGDEVIVSRLVGLPQGDWSVGGGVWGSVKFVAFFREARRHIKLAVYVCCSVKNKHVRSTCRRLYRCCRNCLRVVPRKYKEKKKRTL